MGGAVHTEIATSARQLMARKNVPAIVRAAIVYQYNSNTVLIHAWVTGAEAPWETNG